MQDPRQISIDDYSYELPEEKIAVYPLTIRDDSKLLIYKEGQISEDIYRNIAEHLSADSLLVFNNTKVVEARILFQKLTGGQIEIFCLEPHEQYPDIVTAFSQKQKVLWHCLVGGASKWKPGQSLEKKIDSATAQLTLHARYIEKRTDSFIIELSWTPAQFSFAEILHYAGAIPLPPYIKRVPEKKDAETYQTIYAKKDGSVAAPTAGLHFTENIFSELELKKIEKAFITLHVGAGTFKPVKANSMHAHDMHSEWIDVDRKTIEKIIGHLDKKIIAVGTTSLRTIESLYWMGVKIVQSPESLVHSPELNQWEAYELQDDMTVTEALRSLLQWMEENKLERLISKTQILIAPGYQFKIIDGLITNFHQPRSTLLLLVAALVGENWKTIYDYALKNKFRFLSYGDGTLLWKV